MDKINKEELMKKMEISDEELEKVAGGYESLADCYMNLCIPQGPDSYAFRSCKQMCDLFYGGK